MKEDEKIEKYEDLRREISKVGSVQTTVIPIIIGALGTITDLLTYFLAMVGVSLSFETIQMSALLGSAHILRKVLERLWSNAKIEMIDLETSSLWKRPGPRPTNQLRWN